MHPKALRNIVNDWLTKAVIIPAASLMAKPHKNSRQIASHFLANGRNMKMGVDKWRWKRYHATIQGGHAMRTEERRKSVMKKLSAVMMSMEMCMCSMCMFRRAQIGQLIFPDGMASC